MRREVRSIVTGAFLTVLAVPAVMAFGAVVGPIPSTVVGLDDQAVRRAYAVLPLAFEPNRGQLGSTAAYLARGSGYAFLVGPQGATLSFTAGGAHRPDPGTAAIEPSPPLQTMRVELIGADPQAVGAPAEPAGTTSSFLGADGSRWRTAVPDYGRVAFRGVYPGIDLVYHGVQGSLEYDFVVAPGADPRLIRLRLDGAPATYGGAGEVALALTGGTAVQHPATLLQTAQVPGPSAHPHTTHVGGRLVPAGHHRELRLQVGEFDRTRPLVVDPLITWSPALGGGVDENFVTATDRAGNAYVVTATPRPEAASGASTLTDVAALKLDREGRVVYRTFLDGAGASGPSHVAVDDGGALDISGPALPGTGTAQLAGSSMPRYTMHLDPRGLPLPRTGSVSG